MNMSFSLTTDQIRHRVKFVTRRVGWDKLKPGRVVTACVKCQGLKKGEKVERITRLQVVTVRQERLDLMTRFPQYGKREAALEGFPELSGFEFVEMFCLHMRCKPDHLVNRIEFEYVEGSDDG